MLTFDRFLLPFSVTRQSFAFRDAFNQAPVSPTVVYDPVTLTVTISSPSPGQPWLLENQPYKVILPVPKDDTDLNGLRAIDGATLGRTVVLEFFTKFAKRPFSSTHPGTDPRNGGVLEKDGPTRLGYCDVQPIFLGSCSGKGSCHVAPDANDGGLYPPMGMLLTTPAGIRNTAIGRASEEMNRTASSQPLAPGKRFGENMPIIDPGNPGGSYLIYKVLAHGQSTSPAISDDEATRLLSRIAGTAMPTAVGDRPAGPLGFDDAEKISTWIAQGARIEDECPSR